MFSRFLEIESCANVSVCARSVSSEAIDDGRKEGGGARRPSALVSDAWGKHPSNLIYRITYIEFHIFARTNEKQNHLCNVHCEHKHKHALHKNIFNITFAGECYSWHLQRSTDLCLFAHWLGCTLYRYFNPVKFQQNRVGGGRRAKWQKSAYLNSRGYQCSIFQL